MSTPAPPPRPPFDGEDSSGLPSPEVYDKLVSDFLHSDDEERRDDIADRLETDSQSEETVIRYYAVEAMSKLGREVFGNALLNATEDDNEAVRAIAVEALRR
jgi:HEAT repeat protein